MGWFAGAGLATLGVVLASPVLTFLGGGTLAVHCYKVIKKEKPKADR